MRPKFAWLKPRRVLPPKYYWSIAAGSFFAAMGIWSWLTYGGIVSQLFLPTPSAVLEATFRLALQGYLVHDVGVSVFRVTLGFLAAAAVAVPLGIILGTFDAAEALLEPVNDFIRYMPVAAFIPLTVLWVGIGHLEKIVIIFIGTFFQLVLLVADETSRVPDEYLDIAYTLGASRFSILNKILLPAALPGIFDALRVSIGWAWSYLIVAEIVAANSGIGYRIMEGQRYLKTAVVVSGMLTIGLVGLLTDYLFKLARKKLFRWVGAEKFV